MLRLSALFACSIVLAACVPSSPGGGGPPGGRWHPVGFADPAMHGPELRQQAQDCRGCHGEQLQGFGTAPSCDGCHAPVAEPTAWRTDCTFCHGGQNDDTGAPPIAADGTDTPGRFPLHAEHVTSPTLAQPMDCLQCHVKAIDVLSPGHVFDDTKGTAENAFGAGIAPQTIFDAEAGCANVYCHGDGRGDTGSVGLAGGAMTCVSCHAGMDSAPAERGAMSGAHGLHLAAAGVTCAECHSAVTTDGVALADVSRHVNGQKDVTFLAAGFAYDTATQKCTGSCHGHPHGGQVWGGGGGGANYHPAGWSAPEAHGPEFLLQRQDCRSCHGQNLEGGSGPGCDGCHTPQQPTAWRSNCTFCHGGTKDQTGAPPRDPGAAKGTVAARFAAHPKHVVTSSAPAMDCSECHVKPTDVLSAGHVLDATPEGVGEVTMAGSLSPQATYAFGTGTCSNVYCHGNGRVSGAVTDGTATTCSSCHASMQSGEASWGTMSGDHRKHLQETGVTCGDCHATVTDNGTAVKNPTLHVDKLKQVKFGPAAATMTYDAATKRCTGPCHGENHSDIW
jgi:predicted CxxxxCH...CXXCH cytochrome family protein